MPCDVKITIYINLYFSFRSFEFFDVFTQCTLHVVQCTLYIAMYIALNIVKQCMYCMQCTMHVVQCTFYIAMYIACLTMYIVHFTALNSNLSKKKCINSFFHSKKTQQKVKHPAPNTSTVVMRSFIIIHHVASSNSSQRNQR